MAANRYTLTYEEQLKREKAIEDYYKRLDKHDKLNSSTLYNMYAIGSAQVACTSVNAVVEAMTYTLRTERGYVDYEAEQGYRAIFAY